MKKGFTLAETIITLGIIGIIAALTLPVLNSARPDANKIKYLKTYDSLSQTLKSLASNTEEYPENGRQSNAADVPVYDMSKCPLLNIHDSLNVGGNRSVSSQRGYSGVTKLCNLLAWSYNAENDAHCNDSIAVLGNDPSAPGNNYFIRSFTANNGVDFSVRQRVATTISQANSTFGHSIIIDINGADNPNCLFNINNNNCTRPDRFWFFVTADGNLTPADRMGQYYIQTRKATRLRKLSQNELNALPDAVAWNDVRNKDIAPLK